MPSRIMLGLSTLLLVGGLMAQEQPGASTKPAASVPAGSSGVYTSPATSNHGPRPGKAGNPSADHSQPPDYFSHLFVLVLATFIGLGVVARVSRLLHTPLMSLTNAISGIAVVGSIIVAGSNYPLGIRLLGVVALFASMTNVVSGFLITDRMLKMFKQPGRERKP